MTPTRPPVEEGHELRVFGRDQPQYIPLPASIGNDGSVVTEWELSAEDLACIVNGGRIRVTLLHTGVNVGLKLTPMRVQAVESQA